MLEFFFNVSSSTAGTIIYIIVGTIVILAVLAAIKTKSSPEEKEPSDLCKKVLGIMDANNFDMDTHSITFKIDDIIMSVCSAGNVYMSKKNSTDSPALNLNNSDRLIIRKKYKDLVVCKRTKIKNEREEAAKAMLLSISPSRYRDIYQPD